MSSQLPSSVETGPAVTCVIATHNRCTLVIEAVESALVETLDIEVVVVDDGSRDNTWATLQARYGENPRVVLIRHETAQGGGHARNTGLRAAKGRYITFLDDDDLNVPGRLRGQYELAIAQGADFVSATRCIFETEDGTRLHGAVRDRVGRNNVWLRNPFVNVACMASAELIKAQQFDTALTNGEDLDLWTRCLHACRNTVNYSEPVIRYRRLGQQSLSRKPMRRFRSRMKFYRKHRRNMGLFYGPVYLSITFAKLVLPEPHLLRYRLQSWFSPLRPGGQSR